MMLDVVGWNVTWFVVKWLAEEKTCSWHPSTLCSLSGKCMEVHGQLQNSMHVVTWTQFVLSARLQLWFSPGPCRISECHHRTKKSCDQAEFFINHLSLLVWHVRNYFGQVQVAAMPSGNQKVCWSANRIVLPGHQPVSMARTHRCWCQTSLWPPWGKWLLKCLFASFPCSVLLLLDSSERACFETWDVLQSCDDLQGNKPFVSMMIGSW